ncbi:protein TolA [Pseudolabrys sp. Root1462]|uniref:protein TolA n=1 Tax=Pseudolabrys sp. Root1462 TaxID=1736466 RepID=UPI0012E36F78|nr:protein TolA [Pseudolabrys sp. Root1462]
MQMRMASVISTCLHIAVLGWATLSFNSKAFEATPPESLPVDIISEKEFSEVTKGVKDAKKPAEKPKPIVEKVAEPPPKPVEELKPTINDKRTVAENKEAAPPPPQPEAKPPEKKAEPKPPAPAKPDQIADKLKDDKPKPEAKTEPQPMPPKRPPLPKKPEEKFDPTKIAALLDKRGPTRASMTGAELNKDPTLGTATGAAAKLSQSEIDAFRRRVESCWNIPVGARDADNLRVVFRINFRRDGTIERGPDTIEGSNSPFGPAYADSGRRAILQCQPYTMLRPEHYESWKDVEIEFNARQMFN